MSGQRLTAAATVAAFVLVFAAAATAAAAPTAVTGPVTAVGPTTATVTGTVNPNGAATSWYVEYGTTTTYGSQTSPASVGSGTSPVAVSGSLSGLKPGTTYHYRFVAKSSAGSGTGSDGLLTTSAAPEAVTGAASSVTPVSATLNGTVNPNGRDTTWYFEYGTSTSYGAQTATKDAGTGTSPVEVSASVIGLTPSRTYHFRLVATSDAGTTRGADQIFSTSTAPAVTTKAASSVGDTTAKLNGSVNPNGASTTWYFEYGTSPSYGSKTATKSAGSGTSTSSVSTSVTGLTPGTTYHYRLVATNASGTTSGGDQLFTTSGPPLAQTGAATAIGMSTATLTGTLDPRGHSTSWHFDYGTSTSYGLTTPSRSVAATAGAQTVSIGVTGLTQGTIYHFRLVADSSAGKTYGDDATFATTGPTVTLSTGAPNVVYGRTVPISGTVSSGQANESVTIFGERFGATSFASVATVLTGTGGTWSYTVKPPLTTAYKALWKGAASAPATIAVRPAVSLRALAGRRFATGVTAQRSFAGRTVQLQRRTLAGGWLTISRARLDAQSAAVFRPSLPRGLSTLRVAISVNQVGAGYLAGFSPRLSVRR